MLIAETGRLRGPERRRIVALWVGIALVGLWLRLAFPVRAIGFANYDDALFVRLAENLQAGRWLGPYDQLTLVKGMFYPAFIALCHLAGVPLIIGEQMVYTAASGLVAGAVARAGRTRLATLLFAFLLLNPALWTSSMARVIREGLYIGQSTALLGIFVLVLLTGGLGEGRGRRPVIRRLALGALFGLVLGSFWLTREEGVWIVPALVTVFAAYVAGVRPGASSLRLRIKAGGTLAGALALAATTFALSIGVVMLTNDLSYGRPFTVDVKSTDFLHAYGAISRIWPDHYERWVVFPRDARRRAYAVSPAARELEPGLEGPLGSFWLHVSCDETGAYPCHEIFAGWFWFALRSAVDAAGHYRSLTDSTTFYRRLGQEIDTACNRHEIACLAPRATLAPPFRWSYLGDALRVAPRELLLTLDLGGNELGDPPSIGSSASLGMFRKEVGEISPAAFRPTTGDTSEPAIARSLKEAAASPLRQGGLHAVPVTIARATGRCLGPLATILLLPAIVGLALSFCRQFRDASASAVALLALGSLVALLTRVALLCYVDVTAIPVISTLYSLAAMPFVIILVCLGTAMLTDEIRAGMPLTRARGRAPERAG